MNASAAHETPSLTLEVRHETVYRYDSAVSLAQHQAHLRPLDDAGQALLAHELLIEAAPDFRRDSTDALGNAQTHFTLARPHRLLRVCATSRVVTRARHGRLRPATGAPWEAVAARLRYAAPSAAAPARTHFEPAGQFVAPSPYVPRLPALRAWALPSFAPGRPVAAAAIDLMRRLHAEYTYQHQSTQVDTPLAQVLAQRRGVCQDFAHVLIGALRMLGLPARYVSGYLLTALPGAASAGGAAPLVGADASHAWVQVWCPGTEGAGAGAGGGSGAAAGEPADPWLDLDPTNDLVPGSGHVRVAVGRDYGDVAPLRGVIRGGGEHALAVAVATRVVDEAAAGAGPPAASDPVAR